MADTHIRISAENKKSLEKFKDKWCVRSFDDVISILLEIADKSLSDDRIYIDSRICNISNNHDKKRVKVNNKSIDYNKIKKLFDEGYDVFIDGISNKKANYIKYMIRKKLNLNVICLEGDFNGKHGFFFLKT